MGTYDWYREPACPFCRASFVDSDKMQILQIDEDTYRYLNENTFLCHNCGCRVGYPEFDDDDTVAEDV